LKINNCKKQTRIVPTYHYVQVMRTECGITHNSILYNGVALSACRFMN